MAPVCSPEVKAAVMAELLAGQSPAKVAAQYNLPDSLVRCWKTRANGNGNGSATLAAAVAAQKKDLGELIADLLNEILITTRAQAEFYRDADWLRKQSASELGVLTGILVDKAVRILEAAERARLAAAANGVE